MLLWSATQNCTVITVREGPADVGYISSLHIFLVWVFELLHSTGIRFNKCEKLFPGGC